MIQRCPNGFLPFVCLCLCEGHESRADRVMSAPPLNSSAGSNGLHPSAAGALLVDDPSPSFIAQVLPVPTRYDEGA